MVFGFECSDESQQGSLIEAVGIGIAHFDGTIAIELFFSRHDEVHELLRFISRLSGAGCTNDRRLG